MNYEDHWKAAFAVTLREVEGAGDVSVKDVYGALRQHTGDPRRQAKALLACLGTTGWRWSRFDKPLNSEKAYKEMARSFAEQVDTLAHGLNRRQQLLEVAELRPYWEFSASPDDGTPENCRALNGTIKHFKDPFWKDHLPPCGRSPCLCQVLSLSEAEFASRDKHA